MAAIIKTKITRADSLVNILPPAPFKNPAASNPIPAPTSINGMMVAEPEVNPIAISPSVGKGNF